MKNKPEGYGPYRTPIRLDEVKDPSKLNSTPVCIVLLVLASPFMVAAFFALLAILWVGAIPLLIAAIIYVCCTGFWRKH